MNADSVFYQGSSHPVCQDYASVYQNDAGQFAFLADGCSGSQNSDFGSRFLVHSAMRVADQTRAYLKKNPKFFCDKIFSHRAAWTAESYRKAIGLNFNCIDATLLGLFYNGQDIYATMYGDGCLILGYRNKDGNYRYSYYSTEYTNGYPNYPSYEVDANRKYEFVNLSKGEVIVSQGDIIDYKHGGSFLDDDNKAEIITSPEDDITLPASFKINAEGLTFAAMTSDGIETFYFQETQETFTTNIGVNKSEVIKAMFPIKGFQGVFLQRRLQRFFRDKAKIGWHHEDDLSVIAIGDFYESSN